MGYRKRVSQQYQLKPRGRGRLGDVISLPTPKSPHAFRVQKWKVESHSTPGKYYTVSLRKDRVYECSCPQWIYRRKECKHIREVKNMMRGQQPPAPSIKPDYIIDEHGAKQYTLPT